MFEHVLWLIDNKPFLEGFMGHRLAVTGSNFGPKRFAAAREAWFEQVDAAPNNGSVLGNAASFLAWLDLETASNLFERAYELQPTAGWLGRFIIHLSSDMHSCPSIYKDEIRERIIDDGIRSLKSNEAGAPFLRCECFCDAALDLGRYEVVRWCAELLRKWGKCAQIADAYLGLVALREGDRDRAVELMKMKRGYHPHHTTFRLAKELFDLGEREAIIQLIKNFKTKIKTTARNRWLEQIANNEPPDFRDYLG